MKALALFSGGLDSSLAIKVILEQGIDVVALNFTSSFCRCESAKQGCGSAIKAMAKHLGAELKGIYLGQDYLDMVKNPKHGYGKNLNPCIDCRIFKFKKAKQLMEEAGASFIITGEVLGQRPMSQHRSALNIIEKESGLEGMILRPLSAKLFPATIAEQKGWVDREKLLNISGRTRRPQIKLAEHFGIKDYPCPAGGCLLTDPAFSKRVKSALEYDEFNLETISLLKASRFFRITPSFRLFVGRNEEENKCLLGLARKDDFIFEPLRLAGPTAIGKGSADEQIKNKCSQIIAWYTDRDNKVEVKIKKILDDNEKVINTFAIGENELKDLRI